MTKNERSLLLYLESRCVDSNGLIDSRNMNEEDWALAKKWDKEGFILTGRLKMAELESLPKGNGVRTHWVRLSEMAWIIAARERKARSKRQIESWEKTYFKPENLVRRETIDKARTEEKLDEQAAAIGEHLGPDPRFEADNTAG